jgi:serine/threonine-protein kinase RsbW
VTGALCNVRVEVANRPESVVLVREVLRGLSESVGLRESDFDDLRTAVTEACNNVVLHAYDGGEGPLRVEFYVLASAIEVLVRDLGRGIRPRIEVKEGLPQIGLQIIHALARRVQFEDCDGHGTELRMEFGIRPKRPLRMVSGNSQTPPALEAPGGMIITLAPADLARTVLPRLLSTLAAQAHFSTDRIADVRLLADALAARVPRSLLDDRLSILPTVQPREMELRVGPLRDSGSQRILRDSAIEGLGPVIEPLIDEHAELQAGGARVLSLRLLDRR